MSDIPLDEVVYFDCVTHNATTWAVSDADSTPAFAVYEEATDTDIGVGGNMTKRTALTGNYRASFTANTANGFEVGKWYNVIASATVNSIAGKAVVMRFRVTAAEVTVGRRPAELDSAALREALGMAAADLDDQLDAIADGSGGLTPEQSEQLQTAATKSTQIAAAIAGTSITVQNRVNGSTITAVIGDDFRIRSQGPLVIRISDPADGLHDMLAEYVLDDLQFGASRTGKPAGEITGTIVEMVPASTSDSGSLEISIEISAAGDGLLPGSYEYQIQTTALQDDDEFDCLVEISGTLLLEQRTVPRRTS